VSSFETRRGNTLPVSVEIDAPRTGRLRHLNFDFSDFTPMEQIPAGPRNLALGTGIRRRRQLRPRHPLTRWPCPIDPKEGVGSGCAVCPSYHTRRARRRSRYHRSAPQKSPDDRHGRNPVRAPSTTPRHGHPLLITAAIEIPILRRGTGHVCSNGKAADAVGCRPEHETTRAVGFCEPRQTDRRMPGSLQKPCPARGPVLGFCQNPDLCAGSAVTSAPAAHSGTS
jgi:hypothetical protein